MKVKICFTQIVMKATLFMHYGYICFQILLQKKIILQYIFERMIPNKPKLFLTMLIVHTVLVFVPTNHYIISGLHLNYVVQYNCCLHGSMKWQHRYVEIVYFRLLSFNLYFLTFYRFETIQGF
jgi:hypothetical protein